MTRGSGSLPVGRAWEALREDEIACRSLGINTTKTKLSAFAIGAAVRAASPARSSPPARASSRRRCFNSLESFMILGVVVLGGLGSQIGVAVAAVIMIGGIEMLRNLSMLKAVFGPDFDPSNYRMLIVGLSMVLIMVWRPRGLISTRQPSALPQAAKGRLRRHMSARDTDERAGKPTRCSHVEHLTDALRRAGCHQRPRPSPSGAARSPR